ncbi:MAG: SPFH domain-containing protein [Candidatus Odinarchaeum yellowstonii]|uniref:SPFH domain-containing protein n=1 Tax=Odinarchaeota yellowstonii (strain LCB_4) TaxID=1841599 RepID=A0AAF0D2S2_ODILC|nr:MAG: SPFH domain-containing protein [Candidatus Odinarchaeum yellowstonii]
MPQVIEWNSAGAYDIVWKYPVDRLGWGSALVVRENQAAIFYRDGKAYDVLGPGRYELSTANLPFLTKAYATLRGWGKSPFTAEIIFVTRSEIQGKFGGRGQSSDPAPLMFHGEFYFKIEDPKLFVINLVGNQHIYDTISVTNFLRSFIVEKCIDYLAAHDLRTVFTQVDETSERVKAGVRTVFKKWGIELTDLKFLGLDTTEEYRERIFWIAQGVSADKMATLETVKTAAKELGKSGSASIGTGMMLIPQLLQQAQQPAMRMIVCSNCGSQSLVSSNYCIHCGHPLKSSKTEAKFCSKCGAPLSNTAKYCSECGAKVV